MKRTTNRNSVTRAVRRTLLALLIGAGLPTSLSAAPGEPMPSGITAAAADPLTLAAALQTSLAANPALAASRARLDSSVADVRIARSAMLPSLSATASQTRIDGDRASPIGQAEQTRSAGISAQQVLYSERAWADYSIAQSLLTASQQGQRQETLDTLHAVGTAYLEVLRAQSVEAVRRANVAHTRRNLELTVLREAAGLVARSDRLRWIAQLAREEQNLLGAEAARRQAEAELARLLHRSPSATFAPLTTDIDGTLALLADPRLRALFENPQQSARFTSYVMQTALATAPETAQAEALITSRRRALTAANRSTWLPEVALVWSGARSLERDGFGATGGFTAPDDESWSVSLQLSLPLFSGGRRTAEVAQARHELRASEADRSAAVDAVRARAQVALQRTASSYPSIALSMRAAAAANQNLDIVGDAYAHGAVSITEIIDARDTALDAELAAANARYAFLIDFVGVLRTLGDFDILLEPRSRADWLSRVAGSNSLAQRELSYVAIGSLAAVHRP